MHNILEIASRLQVVRKYLKFTQAEMAADLSCSLRALSTYETAQRTMPLSIAIDLNKRHQISINWLLLGLGTMIEENFQSALKKSITILLNHIEKLDLKVSPERRADLICYLLKQFLEDPNFNEQKAHDFLMVSL